MNVHLVFYMLIVTILSHANALDRNLVESKLLPCDYLDSTNITDGALFPNKSIIFGGVEFSEDHYAKINYHKSRGMKHLVDPYIRGCLCELRRCIRFCCPHGAYLAVGASGAGNCQPDNGTWTLDGHILDQYDEIKRVKLDQHFAIVHGFPCKHIFIPGEQFDIKHVSRILVVIRNSYKFVFSQTGHVLLGDELLFSHHNSCLLNGKNTESESVGLNLAICIDDEVEQELQSSSKMSLDRILLTFCTNHKQFPILIINNIQDPF